MDYAKAAQHEAPATTLLRHAFGKTGETALRRAQNHPGGWMARESEK